MGRINYNNDAGLPKTLGMEGIPGELNFGGEDFSLDQKEDFSFEG